MEEGQPHLGLSELLDQDLSSYEFYYSLPTAVREQIQKDDPGSFSELQRLAENARQKNV
ncbi:MAG: hypothetical protein ACLU62_06715 [Hydrogeniiclostridium sp.]|jgi:hypothetical protein